MMTSPSHRVEFLGVPVDLLTLDQTVALAVGAMRERKNITHVALNVAKFVKMRTDPDLRRDVITADIVGLDGMGILVALRLFGAHPPERVAGVDVMFALMEACAQHGSRPFILGARREALALGAGATSRRTWP